MINEITRALNSKSDKVDLKAETIELGLIDDIEKKVEKLKTDKKDVISMINQISQLKGKAKKALDAHISTYNSIRKETDKAKDIAVELGVGIKEIMILGNELEKIFSSGFDGDIVNFLHK